MSGDCIQSIKEELPDDPAELQKLCEVTWMNIYIYIYIPFNMSCMHAYTVL